MRKHLPLCLAIFVFLFVCPAFMPEAIAADATWQIEWKDDGTLEETVSVPDNPMENAVGWNVEKQGNNFLYERVIENWESYMEQTDRLPIRVDEKNYILFKTIQIYPISMEPGLLFRSLNQYEGLQFTLRTSGMIRETSGQKTSDYTVNWTYARSSELMNEGRMAKVVNVDGFLLGISILAIGVVGVFIFFVSCLRKVDKIIEEVYSLDNIQIDDLDE